MTMKRLTAVALRYHEAQEDAPHIVAQGNMLLAKEMKSIARRYGVPICTNEKLADNLRHIETNQHVPSSLYFDIAKAFVNLRK